MFDGKFIHLLTSLRRITYNRRHIIRPFGPLPVDMTAREPLSGDARYSAP